MYSRDSSVWRGYLLVRINLNLIKSWMYLSGNCSLTMFYEIIVCVDVHVRGMLAMMFML